MLSQLPDLARKTFRNPVISGMPGEDHGDPFVIKYLDSFYLYHTGETSGRRGVSVHRSSNLVDWEFQGYALEAAPSGWAWSDLWAPEVVYERGTFYMYISATRRRSSAPGGRRDEGEGDDSGRRLGLARSTTPLGPFVWDEAPLLDTWSIDGHPFRDDDGSLWLFYNIRTDETRLNGARGTGTVCDRLLGPDRVEGRPARVTFPSQPWEGPYGDWYWNEGPYVLKRRGVYYQLYSGGFHRDASYAIGIAEARAPRGPWTKDPDNPIFRSAGRIAGPGHNSFVFGPDAATRYAVYHGYVEGEDGRKVHLDRLLWSGDKPQIAGPTDSDQPVPPDAAFDPRVPHWRSEAWVRGSWVEIAGRRFELSPADVWHQVEAVDSQGRVAVRVGGVLRSSHPVPAGTSRPLFGTDGDVAFTTACSYLEDEAIHDLPASSSYAWRWGASGPLEIVLAVKGSVVLELGGATHELEGGDGRYRVVRLAHHGDVDEIAVHAGRHEASVTDLFVCLRP